MNVMHVFTSSTSVFVAFIGIVSLCVGSFLNVVIYRLPRILKGEKLGINFPISHCPSCQTPLKYWHNIPLISYLLLKSRCAFCQVKIPVRYFLVELLSCSGGIVIAYYLGVTWWCLLALFIYWALLVYCFMDSRLRGNDNGQRE